MKRLVHAPTSPLVPVLASIPRISKSRAPVLVVGESGTGKEGIVRFIHDCAPWGNGPFVPINCGAIPGALLESELFGHVRGAFTGADRARVGRFEAASGGTLFLDEIGEMPMDLQVKLLRVLQERVYTPLGGSQAKTTDARIVAATNVDIQKAVREGRFREDLLFRLDVIRIVLPRLRERPMDIEPLAEHFRALHAGPNESQVTGFTPEALDELRRYAWPGNVRELENVVHGILVMRESGVITAEDVREKLGQHGVRSQDVAALGPVGDLRIELPTKGLDLKMTLERVEQELIQTALERSGGNRARAAQLLGLNRTTLVEKLKRRPTGSSLPVLSDLASSDSSASSASAPSAREARSMASDLLRNDG